MASIRTGIELNDQFSSVIYSIINSVNMAVSSMADMQQAMNADIDTTSIDEARDQLNRATLAADELNQAIQNIESPSTSQLSVPTTPTASEPVQQPIQWQTDDVDVFNSSGVERYQQEIQNVNAMLEQLSNTQNEIAIQANNSNILSPNAQRDMASLSIRIDNVRNRIQQIENNPMNIGTDVANQELEQLRLQLNQAVQQQNELNQAMQDMDISAANDAYVRLSQTISNTERYIRDNADGQGRFNQEIQAGTQQAKDLMSTIKSAIATYATIETVKGVMNASDELTLTTARLNIMNDNIQTTQELLEMVYVAANDARGSFGSMADIVARFGNNAGDAFSSSAEVVSFANLIQKQMTIAGASTQEASNAMLQLSQALGSGTLRGDELNSIFEQSPNLIRGIADYIEQNDVLIEQMAKGIKMKSDNLKGNVMGNIRDIASEGLISADIVKASVFSATDEINEKFNSMPMTWGQIWQQMQNTALVAFQPVLQRINDIGNSEGFQNFTNTAINDFAILAGVVLNVFELISQAGGFIADNWGRIAPIIGTVVAAYMAYKTVLGVYNAIQAISNGLAAISAARGAIKAGATLGEAAATTTATGAQVGLNTALLACPLTWIIFLIIALIAVIIAVANHIARTGGTATTTFGVITGGINVVIQFFKNLGLEVANIALGIGYAIAAVASNIMIAFHNAIASVQFWWYDLLSTVLTVVAGICEALNKLPFVEFDYSGVTSAADDYAEKSAAAANSKQDYTSVSDAFNKGMNTFNAFDKGWVSDAYEAGANWGNGVSNKVKNAVKGVSTNIPNDSDYMGTLNNAANSAAQTAANTASTADSADKVAKSVEITSEDLKYLRDIAERDVINRYTTASISVSAPVNATINNDMDLDGITEHLRTTVEEQMAAAAEGVH